MKKERTTIIFFLFIVCCLIASCENNKMKYIDIEDGIILMMNTADSYYIGFSQEVDDVILYPNKDYEMRIPYTIIDNDLAIKYICSVQFNERYNERKYSALVDDGEYAYFYYCAPFVPKDGSEAEYKYWIYIKIPVEEENSFKYDMEIGEEIAINVLSDKLELYESSEK